MKIFTCWFCRGYGQFQNYMGPGNEDCIICKGTGKINLWQKLYRIYKLYLWAPGYRLTNKVR